MIRALVISSRPLSWVNTAFPFAAAYLLSERQIDATLVVGTVFFLIPYNLLMYGVNDVFDYASDLRNPRKGGVEGALLPPEKHRAVLVISGLVCVPFLIYLFAVGSVASSAVLIVSVFAVLAYSVPGLRFKERPFLDSITSSTHFVSPAIFGLVLAGTTWTPALILVIAAFALWGIGSHAFGAVQDVVPDREGGIASIATVIGAKATVRLSIVAYLLAGALLLFTPWPGPLAAILVVPYVANELPWWSVSDTDSADANRGWRRFLGINYVVGFLVTLLLIWWWLLNP